MDNELDTASAVDTYSLEAWMKARVIEEAARQDLSKSQVVRRALREYFSKLDTVILKPTPNGKAAKVAA